MSSRTESGWEVDGKEFRHQDGAGMEVGQTVRGQGFSY